MELRIGYELHYQLPQPTPMVLILNVHYTRVSDLVHPDNLYLSASAPMSGYRDSFGNWCTRLLAPAGDLRIHTSTLIRDTGELDPVAPDAWEVPVQDLPEEAMVFLLASRFCDSDRLLDLAWELFGQTQPGWSRVQAVCDFVHQRIRFGYADAKVTRTASMAYEEQIGVCRDYAHLAVSFCRALNIPARYCTGYLSDIGTPLPHPAGDFAAWFEVFLGGRWHMFDPRNNSRRIGRVLIARGRDAADVAIATTYGPNTLQGFSVTTEEAV